MFVRNFWPGIAWGVLIFILSVVPGNYFPHVQSFSNWLAPDKLIHLFLYGVFTYLILIGLIKQKKSYNHKTLLLGFVFVIMWGGLIEVLQYYYFVGRNGNLYDFLANLLGCTLSYMLILYVRRKKTIKSN